MSRLLIIDDEPDVALAIRAGFRKLNVDTLTAGTAKEGLKAVDEHRPDAVLLDIGLPDLSGMELFEKIHEVDSRIPVIFMTGRGGTTTAIEAMKLGAFDYVLKPFRFDRIREPVLQALEISRLTRVPVLMPDETLPTDGNSDLLVGRSEAMQEVYKMIGRVAPQNDLVLIRGESGTGKELVARAIYQHSRRADAPFLAINCAAIPETLLESELFGHERGAFTGADRRRVGKFEQCSGGTLFLDEIGDITPLTQVKLLRVLQEQQFERVGGAESIRTDVRLIAATNRKLEQMVAADQFRDDLYYRLNIFTIWLPPLRERSDDLPLLVEHFVTRFSREMRKDVRGMAPESIEILKRYPWPGNLRELQSVLKQALLQAVGPLLIPDFLPDSVRAESERPPVAAPRPPEGERDWDEFIDSRLRSGTRSLYAEWAEETERHLLTRVLRHTGGKQSQAAALLGITRRSLRTKLRAHGIRIEQSVSAEDDE